MAFTKRQNQQFVFNPEIHISLTQLEKFNLFAILPQICEHGYYYVIPTRSGTLNEDFNKFNYLNFITNIHQHMKNGIITVYIRSYSNKFVIVTLFITL